MKTVNEFSSFLGGLSQAQVTCNETGEIFVYASKIFQHNEFTG